jgi:hypothetical protein
MVIDIKQKKADKDKICYCCKIIIPKNQIYGSVTGTSYKDFYKFLDVLYYNNKTIPPSHGYGIKKICIGCINEYLKILIKHQYENIEQLSYVIIDDKRYDSDKHYYDKIQKQLLKQEKQSLKYEKILSRLKGFESLFSN